jgi:ribosomal 30S subunit maturation factor RimM
MRKIIILILVILLMLSGLAFGDDNKAEKGTKKQSSPSNHVTKTYFLKHISPMAVDKAMSAYFWSPPSYDRSGNMITVRMLEENIPEFEALLKKIDVEKKKVLIRVFTVIASNEGKSSMIENNDLKRVLSELQKVLSFKAFRVDGASALTVKDGQERGYLQLSSSSSLKLELRDIYIKEEKPGDRIVGFEFILDQKSRLLGKDGDLFSNTLIRSETSVKENGYLVAGVSKIGENGDSLVLVINAEIK